MSVVKNLSRKNSLYFIYQSTLETPNSINNLINEIFFAFREQIIMVNLANNGFEQIKNICKKDKVLIHNTASYFPEHFEKICSEIRKYHNEPISVMKQDEHLNPYKFDRLFIKYGVQTVFTGVRDQDISKVYPLSSNAGIKFKKMYFAYLTNELINKKPSPLPDYKLISYRGSVQPWTLGRLGEEKLLIPEWICSKLNDNFWNLDVSSEWEDRLYGDAWVDLIDRSWLILGSESGSNSFNLDGNLIESAAKSKEERRKVLDSYEDNVYYASFAPRHLEAAASGRTQLLLPGSYDGLFENYVSAVFSEPEFGNLDEILGTLLDKESVLQIGRNAREVVLSRIDLRMPTLIDLLASTLEMEISKPLVRMLVPHPFKLDPRNWSWEKELERANFDVEICDCEYSYKSEGTLQISKKEKNVNFVVGESFQNIDLTKFSFKLSSILMQMRQYLIDGKGSNVHLENIKFCLMVSFSFNFYKQTHGAANLNFGIDLFGGFSALIQKDLSGIPYFYDAQEIFSESVPGLTEKEKEFWNYIEYLVQSEAEKTITVSDGVAKWFKNKLKTDCVVVPNWEYKNIGFLPDATTDPNIKFVMFGRFADQRGIKELINKWPKNSNKLLFLYIKGLPNNILEDARQNASIKVMPIIDETDILSELSKYDVGLITYEYDYPYNHCSPNKLGQYFASNLAIYANQQPFVAEAVVDSKAGETFNWNTPNSFEKGLVNFDRQAVQEFKIKSQNYFHSKANFRSALKKVNLNLSNFQIEFCKSTQDLPYLECTKEYSHISEKTIIHYKYKSQKEVSINNGKIKKNLNIKILDLIRVVLNSSFGFRLKSKFSNELKHKIKAKINYWK